MDDSDTQPLLTSSNRLVTRGTLTVHPNGEEYSYSYGPKGLAGLRHNYYALTCAIFASIGGLTFGYDQGVIANVLVMKDFMRRWPIGPWEKGLMSASNLLARLQYGSDSLDLAAVLELGALFGALAAGVLADKYSRRHSICLACGEYVHSPCHIYSYANLKPPSDILYRIRFSMRSQIID